MGTKTKTYLEYLQKQKHIQELSVSFFQNLHYNILKSEITKKMSFFGVKAQCWLKEEVN